MSSNIFRTPGFTPHEIRKQVSRGFDEFKKQGSKQAFHQVEVEHCMHINGAKIDEMKSVYAAGIRSNAELMAEQASQISDGLGNLEYALSNIEHAIGDGLRGVRYSIEAGNVANQWLMVQIWKGVNPEGYRQYVTDQQERETKRQNLARVSHEYVRALKYAKDAGGETNQSKAALMLEEAETCFKRATGEQALSIDANLHLATLYYCRDGNLDAAASCYKKALGEPFSEHWVRVSRLLANLDYQQGGFQAAHDRMTQIVAHMESLEEMAERLRDIQCGDDWMLKKTKLKSLFERHSSIASMSGAMTVIRVEADRGNIHTALEAIVQNGEAMAKSVLTLRPDPVTLYDASRYANKVGLADESQRLLAKRLSFIAGLKQKHLALVEAMTCPDFVEI